MFNQVPGGTELHVGSSRRSVRQQRLRHCDEKKYLLEIYLEIN